MWRAKTKTFENDDVKVSPICISHWLTTTRSYFYRNAWFNVATRGENTGGCGGVTPPTDRARQFAGQWNPFAGHELVKFQKFNFGKQKSTTSVVPFLSGGLCELLSHIRHFSQGNFQFRRAKVSDAPQSKYAIYAPGRNIT